MMYKIPLCRCGHDKASHHEGKYCCLAMLCDCTSYRDETKPDPPKQVATPMPAPDDDDDTGPDTPRTPHPSWCTCDMCMGFTPPGFFP